MQDYANGAENIPAHEGWSLDVSVFGLEKAVSDFFQDYGRDMQSILNMIEEAGVGWKSQPEAS